MGKSFWNGWFPDSANKADCMYIIFASPGDTRSLLLECRDAAMPWDVGVSSHETPVGVSSRVLGAMPQLRASVPCHASASVPPFSPLLPIYSSLPLLFLSSFHTLGSRELAFRTSAWKIVETKLLLPSDYPFSTDSSPSCLAIFQDLPCLQSLCPWCLPGCLRPSFSSEAIWGIKLSR